MVVILCILVLFSFSYIGKGNQGKFFSFWTSNRIVFLLCGTSAGIRVTLIPRLSVNVGEDKRAWCQMFLHALDIAEFHSDRGLMRNNVFKEDDVLVIPHEDVMSFHRITPAPQTTIVQTVSDVSVHHRTWRSILNISSSPVQYAFVSFYPLLFSFFLSFLFFLFLILSIHVC